MSTHLFASYFGPEVGTGTVNTTAPFLPYMLYFPASGGEKTALGRLVFAGFSSGILLILMLGNKENVYAFFTILARFFALVPD